jgi:hypothetical protein
MSKCLSLRAVPSFELAISQAIYHSKWLLGRFLGLMKGIEGQAAKTSLPLEAMSLEAWRDSGQQIVSI